MKVGGSGGGKLTRLHALVSVKRPSQAFTKRPQAFVPVGPWAV